MRADGRGPMFRPTGRTAAPWLVVLTAIGVIVVLAAVGYAIVALTGRTAEPAPSTARDTRPSTPTVSERPTDAPQIAPQSEPTPTTPSKRPTTPAPAPAAPAPPAEKPSAKSFIVVIDPGHQGKSDPNPEPIGPGATQTKPGVSSGTQGVVSRVPESVVALQVSLKLRDTLEKRGYTVVMTRTSQDVRLTNSQRATIANKAHANLFIRLHADGGPSADTKGISTLVPARNQWTGPIVAESDKAGRLVQAALIAKTGAENDGVKPRGDITGFNWSSVPTILPELGFMTNPTEDRLLNDPAYQSKLAEGMADGIDAYAKQR